MPGLLEYSQLFSMLFHISESNEQTLELFSKHRPQLFLLYCSQKESEVLAEIKFLRQLSPATPVLAVSNSSSEDLAVAAYQSGIIDFVHLPCGSREFYFRLAARLQSLRLINKAAAANTLHTANMSLSLKSNQVLLDGEFVPLTNTEYKLLVILATNLNRTVSIETLYETLWDSSDLAETSRTLSMHISKLRHKLGFNQFTPLNIITIHKKGYCLKLNNKKAADSSQQETLSREEANNENR